MINRCQICSGAISAMWILLVITSILLVRACRIKYEIIPQTVQIESFTYDEKTYEYVKEFSYYDKKRNIHTITSNLFIDPEANGCSCGIDYNYLKDGDNHFKESCEQLTKLSTKQKYRIESEHLWYTSNVWMVLLTIFIIIAEIIIISIGIVKILNRLDYHADTYYLCSGCSRRCAKNSECMWGKFVDNEDLHKDINKFFGFF